MASPTKASSQAIEQIIDDLFKVRNPDFMQFSPSKIAKYKTLIRREVEQMVERRPENLHGLSDALLTELTTARNKLLITSTEQEKLRNTVVGFFGLSVGSHAATAWMLISRAKQVKICDPDILSPSNLNRLAYSPKQIGMTKTKLMKKKLTDIYPSTCVHSYSSGNFKSHSRVVESNPKLDFIVDSIDDLESKIHLRALAKRNKIALLSAVDVGDNVFLDVERYDLPSQPDIFLGRLGDISDIKLDELSPLEKKRLLIQLVGLEHNSERMLNSLLSIGKEIPTWPQLGSTAMIAGGLIATTIKNIVLGSHVNSGRKVLAIDELVDSDHDKVSQSKTRNSLKTKILQQLSVN